MSFHSARRLHHSVCVAALAVALVAGPSAGVSAQPGTGGPAQSTSSARALEVLRQLQLDSVKVDSRHWQAAQRCDLDAMREYQRQLDSLAAQARNVIRNSGLETARSGDANTAAQIAENIEMRARHAASRQPQNCGGATGQEGSGGAGTTGSTSQQHDPPPTPPRSAADEQRELARQQEAIEGAEAEIELIRKLISQGRCIEALIVANQFDDWIDAITNPPPSRLGEFEIPPPKPPSIPPETIREWQRRIDELFRECPEPQQQPQQGGGSGGTGASTTGSTPQQDAPPPPSAPPPVQTPRFNSGSPLDGIRNQAWSAMEEITDAYEQCDPERFERALNELGRLRRDAKAAADAARGSAEFSTISPEEAQNLADELQHQIGQRRYILDGLKRECGRRHRPGETGTLLGPRRPGTAAGTTAPNQPAREPQQPEIQPAVPGLLDILGGGRRAPAPDNSGVPNGNVGAPGGEQQQPGGNAQEGNQPMRDVRSRPTRDPRRDRCDRPESERPADCPPR